MRFKNNIIFNMIRPLYRLFKKVRMKYIVRKFDKTNNYTSERFSKKNRTNHNIVVSLTSHGARIQSVYLTIESILRGSIVPCKIILWLDDEDIYNSLPESLVKLKNRGLDIVLTKNYGPHTKYFPYILEGDFSKWLVTADDDIIYPKNWLYELWVNKNDSVKEILCHRAHTIQFCKDLSFREYNEWKPCNTTKRNIANFATGVSGVIYPPYFQSLLFKEGAQFLSKCPKADDVWLHYVSFKYGYEIRQISNKSKHFLIIDDSQEQGLRNDNVNNNYNDSQILKTYNHKDMNDIYHKSRK